MRVTKSRPGGFDLNVLVGRLNTGLQLSSVGVTKKEASSREKLVKRVRNEIVRDVNLILETWEDDSSDPRPLKKLVDKINTLKFQGNWDVFQSAPMQISEGEVEPIDARAIKIGKKHYLVQRAFTWNTWGKWSYLLVRQMFYQPLLSTLESGEFNSLKSCRRTECQKFFVGKDPRQGFCNNQCRNIFNNQQRLEKGTDRPNYFTRLRHKTRERDIRNARRLLKEGNSPADVVRAIPRLTIRILRREGLVPKK